jgi:hypothetical protein
MRWIVTLAGGVFVGACTTGELSVPGEPPVLYEVPQTGSYVPYGATGPSAAGGAALGEDDFTRRIEGALGAAPAETAEPPGVSASPTPIDDDELNLTLYTIEQQKLDAAAAERELAHARSQLVIVEPGALPSQAGSGENIALFAQRTTNAVGEQVYPRNRGLGFGNGCGRYQTADAAQRAFLAAGGPQQDSYNLDPDGDGFACAWDPAPYRALKL